MDIIPKITKAMLKTRCSVQLKSSNTPPHEQGTNEVKFRIITMYIVNKNIRKQLALMATILYLGIMRNTEITISTEGTITAIYVAKAVSNGDLPSCV